MQNFIRSIGFSMYKKKTEIRELLDNIQSENIASSKIVVTPDKERLWEIRKDFSPSLGICIHGYLENIGSYVREGYYPYIKSTSTSSESNCIVERHIDDISYSGMLEDNNLGMSLIFRLSNSFDYLENIQSKIKSTDLFGFCVDGKILLPIKKTVSQMELSKQKLLNKNILLDAANNGDEDAIEALTSDELILYATLNTRIQNEDLYSIVDTVFMPYGMETDMYSILGNILDVSEEVNILTGEVITLLKVECNEMIVTVAIKSSDLQGEPKVGRRFKGNIWVHGNIHMK